EYGEPDAYGHRKKASVAESLADEIKRRTGEETMTSDLTYDLRSGDPDFVDKLVGLTFGNLAYDPMLEGKTGLMSALVKGCYELVPLHDPSAGPRKLTVATMYNRGRHRPMSANKRGLPVFLRRAPWAARRGSPPSSRHVRVKPPRTVPEARRFVAYRSQRLV